MTEVARTRIRASIPPHTESGIHPAGMMSKTRTPSASDSQSPRMSESDSIL